MKNYRLVMQLDDTDLTRTVTLPACMDFERLQAVINKIFGFDNSHEWQFENAEWTLRLDCEIVVEQNMTKRGLHSTTWPHLVELQDVFTRVGKRMYYSYDFGDGWRVTIRRAADPKSDAVVCEKTTGTYALDDIGGPCGLMSYRRRLAASTFDYPPDYNERTVDMSDTVLWWGFGCRAKREKFLAGPDAYEITGLLRECATGFVDCRVTDNARYAHPGRQELDAEWKALADDMPRRLEIAGIYDAGMRQWAEVVSGELMPFAENRTLQKTVAVKLGLCSMDKKKVIVENMLESDLLFDYLIMMHDDGAGTLAKRFIDHVRTNGDDQERAVAKLLSTYRYRALRVKNFIYGLGIVATDLFEGKDHLVVNVELSKCGDQMDYVTLFSGTVDMGGFLTITSAVVPYDLPNVESLIDGNCSDLELVRDSKNPLDPKQEAEFAAKMITDLVESGYTTRVMGKDK